MKTSYRCWYIWFSWQKQFIVSKAIKVKVNYIDVGNLKTVPIDLTKTKWCSEERSNENH